MNDSRLNHLPIGAAALHQRRAQNADINANKTLARLPKRAEKSKHMPITRNFAVQGRTNRGRTDAQERPRYRLDSRQSDARFAPPCSPRPLTNSWPAISTPARPSCAGTGKYECRGRTDAQERPRLRQRQHYFRRPGESDAPPHQKACSACSATRQPTAGVSSRFSRCCRSPERIRLAVTQNAPLRPPAEYRWAEPRSPTNTLHAP